MKYFCIEESLEEKKDSLLNVYNVFNHRETIYDCCWYPLMNNSLNDSTFITCSRDSSILMYNIYNNKKHRASYKYVFADVYVTPYTCTFSSDATQIIGGYDQKIGIFHTIRPVNQPIIKPTINKNKSGIKGKITNIKFFNYYFNPSLFCVSNYIGYIGIFDKRCKYILSIQKYFVIFFFLKFPVIQFFF